MNKFEKHCWNNLKVKDTVFGCSCNIDLKEEFYRDDLSIEELDERYKHEENFKRDFR